VRYLLDSTLVIDHGLGDPAAVGMLRKLIEEGHTLYTCDVVTCESLSFGESRDSRHLESLLDYLESVATSPTAARWAGASRSARHRAGGKRAVGDAHIAGVAAEHAAIGITRNEHDFETQGIRTLSY
jgi:predicted nucleic acid-binding protein